MKIKEIRLKNFKRFSDTTITDIPPTARLIFLVGPNGCGKSSLIEAVHAWHRLKWAHTLSWDESYHSKQMPGISAIFQDAISVTFHDPQPQTDEQRNKAIYARSAYRNDPEFQLTKLSRVDSAIKEIRINRLIDNDQAVSRNYHRLVSYGVQDLYELAKPDETFGAYRERSIGALRDSLSRLFPGLMLNSLGNPLSDGSFRFDKGESKRFLYKNLSGGEKAAFDLILDIMIKRNEFDDTVFFIDEPEAHIASGLQATLLDELFRAVPDNSQLWLATHSIGMMRQARRLAESQPGAVVFIDFDGIDFDLQQELKPCLSDRPFWKRAMQIAVDDLAGYVAPEQIVLCEGSQLDGGDDFDASCYNKIFEADLSNTVFLGVGGSDAVQKDTRCVGQLFKIFAPDVKIVKLIDRDDRTDEEISALRSNGVRVLSLRTIESYLLDDDVLQKMCDRFIHSELGPQLIAAKREALANSTAKDGPSDDLKRPAGDIYNAAKRLLPKEKLGGDKREFMKRFCATVVKDVPSVYSRLREDIFGE